MCTDHIKSLLSLFVYSFLSKKKQSLHKDKGTDTDETINTDMQEDHVGISINRVYNTEKITEKLRDQKLQPIWVLH